MEAVWQWGLAVIAAVQEVRTPVLDRVFAFFTFLGDEEFYLLLLPLLFWSVRFGLGARAGIIFLLSAFLNGGLKDALQHPRPFDLDPSLQVGTAEGYGLPSGHAQLSATVWGGLAVWAGRAWVRAALVAVAGLVGFSRVYLGVHFPTDVLGGWLVAVVLLALYVALLGPVRDRLRAAGLWAQLAVAAAVPTVLYLAHPDARATGTLLGVGLGLVLTYRYLAFHVPPEAWRRIARFVVGAVVLLVLYVGLRALSPQPDDAFYAGFRLLRYGVIGLWVSLGAPWLFQVLRLTRAPSRVAAAATAPAGRA